LENVVKIEARNELIFTTFSFQYPLRQFNFVIEKRDLINSQCDFKKELVNLVRQNKLKRQKMLFNRNLLLSILCALLIALWSYAALSKLAEFTTFSLQLKLQPLPNWSIPIIRWGLPVAELGTALLIYFQRTRFAGLIISTILMTVFTFYVLFALTGAYGQIPCSCAGIISELHWRGHLIFNIIFTIFSFYGIYLQKHKADSFIKHNPIPV